ncbi:hypothetical protein PROFUN_09842 [Planoprotostelium fungivorum]|uniref:Uncharacterized protein n=1 Tax=Planoprotostelium fungivorum TaxID=1890364 RepID=A0A2P6NFM3_9EUKA|nr:hypothetical protein PROFUN_09842 [Planoprotostelium fungivorum]
MVPCFATASIAGALTASKEAEGVEQQAFAGGHTWGNSAHRESDRMVMVLSHSANDIARIRRLY